MKLAESGDFEPNGTNVYGLINQFPTLNDRGEVAFNTELRNTNSFLQGAGIFLANGTSVTTLARVGQPPPDLNGNFYLFDDLVALNSTNQAFEAKLNGTLGGAADDYGIYQRSGGTLTELAREAQPTPDGNGTFNNLQGVPVRINRTGQKAFTCGTSSNLYALYRSTGNTLMRLAYYNQPSPDGNGTLGLFFDPTLNNNGQVAFHALMSSSTNGSFFGVFLADESGLKALARGQQTSPDGNGYFLVFPNTAAALNDHGQLAFTVQLAGTSGGAADNHGLYRTDGSTTMQLVRKGQLVPGGNGRFLDFGGQGYVAINNSGAVAFFANLTGTTGGATDNAGVFVADGNTVRQLARKGQTVPGSNGVFATFGYPALNNNDQVAFKATLTGTTGVTTDNQGIFLVDSSLGVQQVIRAGQIVGGKTVGIPSFLDGPNLGGVSGLNDQGQMAVWSALNGNHAVLLWSPPRITAIAKTGNDIRITWETAGGRTNFVQGASNVNGPFTDIGNVIVPTNSLATTNFLEIDGATNATRFYRIRQSP